MPRPSPTSAIRLLPDHPGVYLFFGPGDLLLYVGKSKALRTRIRAHFSSRDERWLCRKVRRIEIRETAGELGALLLESQLIKELRPMYNVMARQRRQIVVARKVRTSEGYDRVTLSAVETLNARDARRFLGIFKHHEQAKDFLSAISKTHQLCSKLLGLDQSRSYCFSYHLGRCGGACMGEEDPAAYNGRLDAAFENRRVKAWPFKGSIVVEEGAAPTGRTESFLVDNWCLLASLKNSGESVHPEELASPRFDYDSYKILYSFVMNPENQDRIRTGESDLQALLQEERTA